MAERFLGSEWTARPEEGESNSEQVQRGGVVCPIYSNFCNFIRSYSNSVEGMRKVVVVSP